MLLLLFLTSLIVVDDECQRKHNVLYAELSGEFDSVYFGSTEGLPLRQGSSLIPVSSDQRSERSSERNLVKSSWLIRAISIHSELRRS
jgi:hypothetical protein